MHGGHDPRRERRRDRLAAVMGDAKARAQQRLRRGGAQADDHLGSHRFYLREEPGPAGGDLARVRLLVDAPLAALARRDPLEVLHGVGHVRLPAIDARRGERRRQQLARRADERVALPVLLIARLLADQEQRRVRQPFAEHRLRGPLPERAGLTAARRRGEHGQRPRRRHLGRFTPAAHARP